MDWDRVASELIVALRGTRSQLAASRRLGYRSNVFANWEKGRRFPTAHEAMAFAKRGGTDLVAAAARFALPASLPALDLTRAEGVTEFLRQLRASASLQSLAESTGKSRYTISRWLRGESVMRLPDFLLLLEALTLRALDFVAELCDPTLLDSARDEWQRLEARRRMAYERPLTEAVLLALDLDDYRARPRHQRGFLARKLGISVQEEDECLKLLLEVGAVVMREGRYTSEATMAVNTGRDVEAARKSKDAWLHLAHERLWRGQPGFWSYNVFSVSEEDLETLRRMHLAHFEAMRKVIDRSEPQEAVGLFSMQLFSLDDGACSDAPLSPPSSHVPRKQSGPPPRE